MSRPPWSHLFDAVRGRPVRGALVLSLALLWVNFPLTTRWANVEGSINGSKRPLYFVVLLAASWFALRPPRGPWRDPAISRRAAWGVAAVGGAFLGVCFFVWFPLSTWTAVPFLDNWPARYQATRDVVALIDRGMLAGWQWAFLGGYQSSSDVTVSLGVLAYLPMKLLGEAVGFHVLHFALFAALPALVWIDLSLDEPNGAPLAAVATGLVAVLSTNYSSSLIRSGDTNSLAGVVAALSAIVGAHAARRGRAWGAPLLVAGLALTNYTHAGFFLYASLFIAIDAGLARDMGSLLRAAVAVAASAIAALPLTWESWRYPQFFSVNNLLYRRPVGLDWTELARKIYYNIELLWLPHRWFNDYATLAMIVSPVAIALVIVDRTRVRFYACGLIATIALMRLNDVQFGYAFLRPIHMFVVFDAVVLGALVVRYAGSRALACSLIAFVALYTQVLYHHVPHVADIRSFNAALVDRIARADGALVLVENNPHRNMNADPGGTTEPSRFGVHFEPLIAAATGRRLYAGYWDGWQWNPWKGQLVAGGTFMGHALSSTPHDDFIGEMRRWGVADLFVWSQSTSRYLQEDPRFVQVWKETPWTEYRLESADVREVVVARGQGRLERVDPAGADVVLSGVRAGERVVVRTNFHPAWTASVEGRPLALADGGGQLSFLSPCDGDCRVVLAYPKRHPLEALAAASILIGMVVSSRIRGFARRLRSSR